VEPSHEPGGNPAPGPAPPAWPEELQPGRVVQVDHGVVRIIAPNPGTMTGPGTNTYVLGEANLALIDPGPDDDRHLNALLETVGDRLRWVLVTHTHRDHSPLARRLKDATGAQLLGFGPAPTHPAIPLDAQDTSFVPVRLLGEGDRLDTGEFRIDAVYTPGHASNHLCFEPAGTGWLFSGDHVMSGSTVVIAPPDGDMAVYLESLQRVKARAPRRIAPGHGDVIQDPGAVLDAYLRHRLEREAQILACLRTAPEGGITAEQLVAAIYTDVPTHLHPVAKYSVWAHLRKLGEEGRAATPEREDLAAPWQLAPMSGRTSD
jgi:glyoxylase-like metal-dependent hydrolase (beta-lactamase superfamily II)